MVGISTLELPNDMAVGDKLKGIVPMTKHRGGNDGTIYKLQNGKWRIPVNLEGYIDNIFA